MLFPSKVGTRWWAPRFGGFLVHITVFVALAACSTAPTDQGRVERPSSAPTVPVRALNPDVRQDTIQQTICTPGYAASVRPATSYTTGVKLKLLREASIPKQRAPDFELDHRVALALGGHPRSLENLALQPWEGDAGAKRKDRLERRLQELVCAGKVALDRAQQALYFDWEAAYRDYVGRP